MLEHKKWYTSLRAGDEVWWNDPDHGISSGYYTAEDIQSEDEIHDYTVLRLKNSAGSSSEVFAHEMSPDKPEGLLPVVYDGEVCGYATSEDAALDCGYNFVCSDEDDPMHVKKAEWPVGEDRAVVPVWVVRDGTVTEQVRLRLTLDVTYDLNGETIVEMKKNLRRMVEIAIGEGLLTGASYAEVDQYSMKVAEFPDADEAEVADFMLQRLESGDLALEDISVRLARYGLMDPADFASEMRERLDRAVEEGKHD